MALRYDQSWLDASVNRISNDDMLLLMTLLLVLLLSLLLLLVIVIIIVIKKCYSYLFVRFISPVAWIKISAMPLHVYREL